MRNTIWESVKLGIAIVALPIAATWGLIVCLIARKLDFRLFALSVIQFYIRGEL